MTAFINKDHLNALPGPDNITRVELHNGITVLVRSNFSSPTLSIRGYIKGGSIFDPPDKLGVGYLTANGLMLGTVNNGFQSLYDRIESVAARLGFSSGTLSTPFSAHCLSEDLGLMMGLIAECLQSPTFPEKECNRQKNQLLTGLAIRAQDTSSMASLLFDQIIYSDHPYRHPEEGYPETVASINRDDLISFYKSNYGPLGMVIAIVGAVEADHAIHTIEQALGGWINAEQSPLPVINPANPLHQSKRETVTITGKSQADIVMGSLAPSRLSPEFHALRLGNNILGEFGMMGRIGQRVREDSGLAYYAYSALNMGMGPGTWEMIAGVNPRHVEQAVQLITEEVKRFVSEPVSEEELEDSKSFFLGRLPLALESNSGVAMSLLSIERFNLGLDYFLTYPNLVQAVTGEDILQASQKYLDPERLGVAIAGPEEIQ
ncbi:MAG: M16 family metallopeptidase [Brevefilum sp.]|jgi:zinc protease